MDKCFVIQPFTGEFDERYEDTLTPAIEDANLEPYRVDEDPRVSFLIESIESEIRSARVCLVDITTDNPNVWYELGYAIATKKQRNVVIICSSDRLSEFPFDVRHLRIIKYSPRSRQSLDALHKKITERLRAILDEEEEVKSDTQAKAATQANHITDIRELDQDEMDTLNTIMDLAYGPTGGVHLHEIFQGMEQHGYNQSDANKALAGLEDREIVEKYEVEENFDFSILYRVTQSGKVWIYQNKGRLKPKKEAPESGEDDGIPF